MIIIDILVIVLVVIIKASRAPLMASQTKGIGYGSGQSVEKLDSITKVTTVRYGSLLGGNTYSRCVPLPTKVADECNIAKMT